LIHLERQWAQQRLQEVADQLKDQGVTVAESIIEPGHPTDLIVRTAQEIDADLVLIGAGERNREDTFTPGPIAEAVLERAEQPVLAIRPGSPEPRFKKILCPVDFSSVSDRGLRNAIGLARVFGSQLTVLTVIPPVRWLFAAAETGRISSAQVEHEQSWRNEFDRFLLGVEFGDVNWERSVRTGVPSEEIIGWADEQRPDLIVMGATGRTGLVRVLLGSVTRRVMQRLPCSLLTVKAEDAVSELLEDDLRNIKLLMAEGRGFMAAQDYVPALRKFRQILARNPFDLEALSSLADAHEKLGHKEKAERCRRRLGMLYQYVVAPS
jgi:nucleotide-binding universal stress UspA family protein